MNTFQIVLPCHLFIFTSYHLHLEMNVKLIQKPPIANLAKHEQGATT